LKCRRTISKAVSYPANICAKALEVHALLFSALPNRTEENLKKAAELLLTDGNFQEQKSTLVAILSAIAALENQVGAAEGETLLLQATQEALLLVQKCCSDRQ
jgi:hypothetical protein